MENKKLKKIYNKAWAKNGRFFTPYQEETSEMAKAYKWKGKEVLDIGCGQGNLSYLIASSSAKKVFAIDYSEEAIKACKKKYSLENLKFENRTYKKLSERFDVIVMQSVLEHFDNPFKDLQKIIKNNLKKKGVLIASCPSFLNVRGYIWMTLQLLFDIPMSLTDLHFFLPSDFEDFCKKNKYRLEYKSTEQSWGGGEKMLSDYNKRLRNALRDKSMKGDVGRLLNWLKKIIKYQQYNKNTGAIIIYKIRK